MNKNTKEKKKRKPIVEETYDLKDPEDRKELAHRSVERTVKVYGDVLKMLGNE